MSENRWQMTRNAKDELVKLALANGKAHGAILRTKNPGFSVSPEKLAELAKAESETMESLKQAVSQLTLEAVKEATGWIQFKATHDPVEPMGQGKLAWNKKTARTLVGALWSLVSALRTVHGKSDRRVGQAINRANSTEDFVKMYNELGYLDLKNWDGMTQESRDRGLRELDKLFHTEKAAGNAERAMYLNTLYALAEKSLAFLKPKSSVTERVLPKNITVNAAPNQGLATMGQALAPVGDSAPVPETAPVAKAEQAVPAAKPKSVGAAPFKSARPKQK